MALSLCLAPILRKFLPVNRGDFQADSRRLGHRLFDERPGEGLVSVFLAEPRDPDLADVSLRLVEREVGEVVQDAPLTEGRLRLFSQGQGVFDDRRQVARVLGIAEDELDVELVGDVPIYVTHDSADVWANRKLFKLE